MEKQTIDKIEAIGYCLELDFSELQVIRDLLLEKEVAYEFLSIRKEDDILGTRPIIIDELLGRIQRLEPVYAIKK